MLSLSCSPKEKQAQEREALQAIFAEDFQGSLVDEASFKIALRAGNDAFESQRTTSKERVPVSVVLTFEMPAMYPLEPVKVGLEQCLGLSIPEEAALKQALVARAGAPDLEGQPAVFAVAQEAQDWLLGCLEARSKVSSKHRGGSNSSELDNKSSDADLELQKKIADDLKRKKQLLLKTPDSDWMHHVGSAPNADSVGDDFDEDEDEEQNKDSLEDDDAVGSEAATTSSSDRHSVSSLTIASSHSFPRTPKAQPVLRTSAPSLTSGSTTNASSATVTAPSKSMRWKLGQLVSESEGVRFYQALNLETGSTMAVRQVHFPAPLSRQRCESVEKKVRYLQHLSSPHLVPCRGFEWLPPGNSVLALFLPDLRGGSLDVLVKSFGPIPELPILRKYAGQMVQGLQFLHERGVLLNNISPATVFLDHRGNVKIADYGWTLFVGLFFFFFVTIIFEGIAPLRMDEEVSNESLIRHDVYCMGKTLLDCASGKDLSPGQMPMVLLQDEAARDFVESAMQEEE